jgi:16S rRNA (uracil1498-N3)-methyltransferase
LNAVSYRDLQKRASAPGFFWTPPDHVTDETVTVFGDEARHAVTVCRLGVGEMITVCDGSGNAYDCEITTASSREVRAKIVRAHRQLGEPVAHVTLAAGVGKPANFDWVVEKSVELGVAKIIPVRAAQSPSGIGGPEASARRVERWRRLSLGAMKQSLRSRRPPVDEITEVGGVVRAIQDHQFAMLADPGGNRLNLAGQAVNRITKVLLIVGPESGFTTDERDLLIERGAIPFNLGARRLRAETAAIAALTLLMRELEEL